MVSTSVELEELARSPSVATAASSPHLSDRSAGSDKPPAHREAFDSYPDAGFLAWSQVASCFILFFTTTGGVYSWGVLQDALTTRGVAPAGTLAWIGSTQATMQAVLAIPINRAVAAYGPRRIALAGTVCAGLGPLLGSFCINSVPGLLITEGFLFGLGQALCFFSAAMLPATYFLRRRNLATGIVFSGAGVGGAVLSIVTDQLLQRLSPAWTFRAIALIVTLPNVPAALALKSRAPRQSFRGSGVTVFDRDLFKDIKFCLLLVGTSLALFPLFVPPFFIPLYATSIGMSTSAASLLVAGFNLASGAGRIGFGLGADAYLGSLNSLSLCLLLVGTSTLVIWPLATTLPPLCVFVAINGLCAGGMFSLIPGTIASIFGSARLGTVFSMTISFWSFGYLLGSPIAGYLLEAFGGPGRGAEAYQPAIFYAGGLSLTAALLIIVVRLLQSRVLFKKL
ncbi:uncharacterized protein JCM10292_005731 [Rhodotorula paludigena]|uniref:uncharacterized protein n=1 Tax=Rhodotorula paludigena TaxID=86838 RepID=UPI00316DF61B